ncbi:hypothetical protein HYS93_04290 [Candidatus Daviesbacteria bacterium]|nr:hypothetical protein [Candidatus Daviesbacteria bacterium]
MSERLTPHSEILNPTGSVYMHYANHTPPEQALPTLMDILSGNYFKTGWDSSLMGRTFDADTYPASLGNVRIMAMDGALPLDAAMKRFSQLKRKVFDPNNPSSRELLRLIRNKGVPPSQIDKMIEAITVHWIYLPFNPYWSRSKEFTLLRGDPFPETVLPSDVSYRLVEEDLQNGYDLYQLEQISKARIIVLTGGLGLVAAAGTIASIVDTQIGALRQIPRLGRRALLLGTAALSATLALNIGNGIPSATEKLDAFEKMHTAKSSLDANQALVRFDAALVAASENAQPAKHNVFRSLTLLTKAEETGDLAAVIMGEAHLWDRQYAQELTSKQERLEFIRRHFQTVLVPILDTTLRYTPRGASSTTRAEAYNALVNHIASVDLVRCKEPDHARFPLSLLDNGVFTPISSYQSPTILKALTS